MPLPWSYISSALLVLSSLTGSPVGALCNEAFRETGTDTLCRWQPVGDASIPRYILTGKEEGSGRVDRILFHPTDSNTFYIASPGGGLWKTTSYAREWMPLTDHLPVTGIADMALSESDPEKLWIATGDAFTHWSASDGIYFSPDGGSTWEPASFDFSPADNGPAIYRITLNPLNDRSVFAGTSDGLFHSADEGASFLRIASGVVRDMEWIGGDSSVLLFTLIVPGGQSLICRSPDGGASFDTVFSCSDPLGRIELAAAQDVAYAAMAGPSGNLYGIYRSDNAGRIWEAVAGNSPNILGWNCEGTDNRGAGIDILSLAVNPWNTNELYAGSNYLWKSADGGRSWAPLSGWCGGDIPYVRPYHRALAFGPDRRVYTGSGGGIFSSSDEGTSWVNVSANLFILPVTGISVSPDGGFLVAGTLENGNMKVRNGAWEFIFDGDGLFPLAFDSLNFIIQVREALSRQIKLLKTTDGGYSYQNITPSGISGEVYSRIIPYPGQENILFFSYGPLFRSTDGGTTWEVITEREEAESFRFLEQSKIRPSVWYGASSNRVWRSADGGLQWEEVLDNATVPGITGEVTSLRINPSDPNLLWVGCSPGILLQSDDGGGSWVDISQGLPAGPVHTLEYDPARQLLFAGTEKGVWARSRETNWVPYGSGLPRNRTTSMHIDAANEVIFAGSLGRGVWKAPLCALDNGLAVDFQLGSYITCGGSATTVTGTATGPVDSWLWDFGQGASPPTASGAGPHEVTYQDEGFRTIALVINDSIGLVRKNLVEVVSDIRVEVLADRICSADTVSLLAMGAEAYEWAPEAGLISDDGHGSVLLYPHGVVTYVVKGSMGNCIAYDTVVIEILADERNLAFTLSPGTNGPFTNACATASDHDPAIPTGSSGTGCNTQDGWCKKRSLTQTVWFRFTIPASGTVSVEAPADFNNQIALFVANPVNDSLVLLAANDDYFGAQGNNAAAITGVSGLEPGETAFIMIDGGGNGETGEFFLVLHDAPLGLEPLPAMHIQVYPNPASGSVWITGIDRECNYQLLSMDGKTLQTGRLQPAIDGSVIRLGLSVLPAQVALLKIYNEELNWNYKLIIQAK